MPAGPSDVMWHVSQLCTLIGTFSPQQRPVTLSATLSLQSFDFFSFFSPFSFFFLPLSLSAFCSSFKCVCLCFVIFVDWLAPALRWKLPMVIYLFIFATKLLAFFFSVVDFAVFSVTLFLFFPIACRAFVLGFWGLWIKLVP